MTTTRNFWRLAKLPMAVSLASALATPAFAVNFNVGEIEGQLDSSLSVGASWSMRGADPDLIGKNNGGKGLSQTSDDAHMNFKKGETFSKIFKGIHDLELKYGDTGAFVRGKYWYDFELKDESRLFKDIDDHGRKEGAQSSGAQILDAFIYHNYDIAEQPGSVRLGKQVVSWGESTFIQNSINAVNPVDVSAFRRPGAEVKEGLIPVNMFFVQQSLTENLSAEAFYQLEWDQTVVDNCGTFFSQADIAADGCTQNLAVLSSNPASIAAVNGALPGTAYDVTASPWNEGIVVRRYGDKDARDSGQFGTAFRYFFEPLDTEFGAYFMNYHSRAPIFSGQGASAQAQATINAVASGAANAGGFSLAKLSAASSLAAAAGAGNGGYFMEYPEDIQLYGVSFSSTLPTGTAWSGEVSYRPNAPVQINSTDILYAGLDAISITTPLGAVKPYDNASLLNGQAGQQLHGYNRKEITQLQTTFTHFFDQVMGASRLTLVGEIGVSHIGGLESSDEVRYGRDPVFGPGPLAGTISGMPTCKALNANTLGSATAENVSKYCEDDGFATATSWGYRARAIWEYPDVFAGVNLKPNVAWSHDVDGYGANGLFTEDAKAVSLGLDAEYQNTYTASVAYTDFFGGKYNTSIDRDFLALSVGVNF
ncbi:MAG: adhesin [Pseudomonas sp. PGPPP3]|nr:MAG: adhesin [Pseudomonas sp. PGPPP3]